MYVSQIIMPYTLNLYSTVRELFLNKTGKIGPKKKTFKKLESDITMQGSINILLLSYLICIY